MIGGQGWTKRGRPPAAQARPERGTGGRASQEEAVIVALVREFTEREVKPVVRELEHANADPAKSIDPMLEAIGGGPAPQRSRWACACAGSGLVDTEAAGTGLVARWARTDCCGLRLTSIGGLYRLPI
jgi:hypothetical protein